MSYTPSEKLLNDALEVTVLKWQKKTSSGTSGLSFNNLTVDQWYRVIVNWRTSGGGTIQGSLFTLSGAATYDGGSTWASIHGNEDWLSNSTSIFFKAATTTLTLNRVADDWGTNTASFDVFLEEISSQEETTEWT